MSKNPLDQLLADIASGKAALPPVGSGAAVGDVADHWPLYQEADGSEYYDTSGVVTRQVRTEVLPEMKPMGRSLGVVGVEVLEPVTVAEVADPDTGALVWLAVDGVA